jgi:hypothetical protein
MPEENDVASTTDVERGVHGSEAIAQWHFEQIRIGMLAQCSPRNVARHLYPAWIAVLQRRQYRKHLLQSIKRVGATVLRVAALAAAVPRID